MDYIEIESNGILVVVCVWGEFVNRFLIGFNSSWNIFMKASIREI